jgi:hypothetical protein
MVATRPVFGATGGAFDLAERTAGDRARHGENGCGHVEMHVEHSAMIHGYARPLAEAGGTTARPPEVRA